MDIGSRYRFLLGRSWQVASHTFCFCFSTNWKIKKASCWRRTVKQTHLISKARLIFPPFLLLWLCRMLRMQIRLWLVCYRKFVTISSSVNSALYWVNVPLASFPEFTIVLIHSSSYNSHSKSRCHIVFKLLVQPDEILKPDWKEWWFCNDAHMIDKWWKGERGREQEPNQSINNLFFIQVTD